MSLKPSQKKKLSRGIQYAILIAIVLFVLFAADWPKIIPTFFNFDVAVSMFPDVITVAFINTIIYTVLGFILGLTLGVILSLMRMSSIGPYRWLATGYVEFFRGIPALLVFIFFAYGFAIAFEIQLNTYVIAMLALGIVSGAYIAETLRSGLQAVPPGQYEAARSLGMSHIKAMATIVIPQAFKIVIPPLTNEIILLTKDSSLVYTIGLALSQYELTKFGRDFIQQPEAGLTPLVVVGLCYLVITIPLSLLARKFEAKSSRKKAA